MSLLSNSATPLEIAANAVTADLINKPREPDLPIVPDILALAELQKRDEREAWQKDREARFAEKIHDGFDDLQDVVAQLASKTETTAKRYALHFSRFRKFANETVLDDGYPMRWLPASEALVTWFLWNELVRGGRSYSTIKQMAASISDAHVANSLPDPCSSLMVRAMVRIARRDAGKYPKAKLNGKSNGSKQEVSHGKG